MPLAMHEAGHAVVGQTLGLVLLALEIPRTADEFWDADTAGRVRWQPNPDDSHDDRFSIAALAGPITECWYRGDDYPDLTDDSDGSSRSSDVRQVTHELGGLGVLTQTGRLRQRATRRLERWVEQAETLVSDHWRDIVSLAAKESGLVIDCPEPKRARTFDAWCDAVIDWGERLRQPFDP